MTNPIAWYDFTLWGEPEKQEEIRNWMKENCKQWGFQEETGIESKKDHWQGRFALASKMRLETLLKREKGVLNKAHFSPTSTTCIGSIDPLSYAMKDYTRKNGPWSSEYEEIPSDMLNPVLRPWQATLLAELDSKPNARTIQIGVDETGEKGKTWFTRYVGIYRDAIILPFFGDTGMLANCIGSAGARRIYVIDIPRACFDKRRWAEFVAFAEALKTGVITELRYKFKQKFIEIPHVIIFCNFELDKSWLSMGRMKLIDFGHEESEFEALTL